MSETTRTAITEDRLVTSLSFVKERSDESKEALKSTHLCMKRLGRAAAGCVFVCSLSVQVSAQVTLQSVVALAVQHSPRLKMAQDDVNRTSAIVSESRNVYIPTLALGGGLGRSYGISLIVPTIFTANAQSLIYNAAQRNYIRAARQSFQATSFALQDVREQVAEDAALTYISLNDARIRQRILADQLVMATELVDITKQRAEAGIENDLDVKRSQRTLLQTELQQPEVANDIATLQEHLYQLTALSGPIATMPETIHTDQIAAVSAKATSVKSAGVLSLEANAKARTETADGDRRYAFHPQIELQAQYGRISPINNVSEYYNLNGQYNTMELGVAIQLPLFDKVHAARTREAAADAAHARHEAEMLEGQQKESQMRLENSESELKIKEKLAGVDWDIAKEELQAVVAEVKTRSLDVTGGRQLTPKDELNARLVEAQRHLDWLDAVLQLQRTEITVSRLDGTLEQLLKCGDDSGNCAPTVLPSP